ncbi:MAG TPA: ABC transporter permease [Candidatus Aphodomonas merdavium]|nr:ABC transporter permease [Candidatus Aphodomonas merdavium]
MKKIKLSNISTVALLLILVAVMFIALACASDVFLTTNNLQNLIRQTAIYGVIAIGMTFVIMSGGIDLSVGSVVGLSGVICAMLMSNASWPIFPAAVAAVLVATLVGVFNGIIIFDGKVPPFIATLGVNTAMRGVIMLITGARMISGLPKAFTSFSRDTFLYIPMLGWVWFIIIAVAIVVIKYTTFGRNNFAVGSNTEAARLSGINIRLTTYGVYTVCAFLSAIAGVLMTARLGNGVPTGGEGYETDAIAAAVLGGASLTGAEGSIIGTVLGSLIMATLRNGGNLLGVNSFVLDIIIGLMIVFAVMLDKKRKK